MKLKTIALVIGSFFVGIAAGLFALSSIPQLNPDEWAERIQATLDPLDPDFVASVNDLDGVRAAMSREDIEISNYYLAEYTDTLQWLANTDLYELNDSDIREFVRFRAGRDSFQLQNHDSLALNPRARSFACRLSRVRYSPHGRRF